MKHALTLLSVVALVGCGDHPVDESLTLGESLIDQVCDCPFASGEVFCTDPSIATSAERACGRQVYDQNEEQIAPNLDCVIEQGHQAQRCLDRASECNATMYNECLNAYGAAIQTCPDIPARALEMLAACRAG